MKKYQEPEDNFNYWDLAIWVVVIWGVYLVAHLVVSVW